MTIKYLLCAFVAGAVCAGKIWAEPTELVLSEAYALTLLQSEALQINESELKAAEARYRSAAAARWPEVHAGGTAVFRDVPASETREREQYAAGLSVGWNLFNGFRTLHDMDARRADGDALRFDLARSRQLLFEDVADVFYQVLSLQGEQQALERQIDALRQRTEELARRMELGRSRRAEWLTVRTQVAENTVTLEQVRGQLGVALEMLALLTGRPAQELKPVCKDPLPGAEAAGAMVSLDDRRPDLEAARRRVAAAQADVAAVKADRNVKVSTDANLYLWQDPDGGDWDVVVRAELPVFDGGLRRANVAAQREEARIYELKLGQLQRAADSEVREAARNFQSVLAQWSAIREAETLAKETADAQKNDYELGRASNLDSLAALVQLHNLSRRTLVLEMQLRAALVRLEVAAGRQTP